MRAFKTYCGGKFQETVDQLIHLGYSPIKPINETDFGPFIVATESGNFYSLEEYNLFFAVTDVVELPIDIVSNFKKVDVLFDVPNGQSLHAVYQRKVFPITETSIYASFDGRTFFVKTVDDNFKLDGGFLKLSFKDLPSCGGETGISGITESQLLSVLIERISCAYPESGLGELLLSNCSAALATLNDYFYGMIDEKPTKKK